MRRAILIALLAVLLLPRALTALPAELVITAPTNFEMMRGDRVSGTLPLSAGAKVDVIDVAGDYVLVRYRNVAGRVLAARTSLPRESAAPAAPSAPVSAPPPAPVARPPAPPKPAARKPAGPIQQALAGKLVRMERGTLRPQDVAQLSGVKFYGLYFSAGWCGPCRAFTPDLIDAYGKIRSVYPEFEVVFVSNDRSASEMLGYMRGDRMPWPAISFDALRGARAITRYAGAGIPCLVLVDENGKVLSDSYRGRDYVGPDTVLDETWKILRDYRQKNPRPKA